MESAQIHLHMQENERFVQVPGSSVVGSTCGSSNIIVKEDGEVQAIFDIELPENGAQVCLDRSFGYIKRSCDGFIIAALVNHAGNFKLPRRKALNR